MSNNPILAAILWAGQPQFMAAFLMVVFLCAGRHLLRESHTPERIAGPVSAGIGAVLMISAFIGIRLYIEACTTGTPVRLPLTVWGFTFMGFVAALVTCAYCLRGGLLQSTAAVATGCGVLSCGSLSLAVGCGALHLGAKTAVALFEVTTMITAIFIVGFIVSVIFPMAKRKLAKKKARV